MLSFKRDQIDLMVKYAKEAYPLECCGLIVGNGDIVYDVIYMKNELESTLKYSMNSREIKNTLDYLDERKLELLGVYHSHPTSRAYPSYEDIKEFFMPELNCFIISLLDKDNPELKNFKIIEEKVLEESYLIID